MDKNIVADRLSQARERLNYNQEGMATVAGVSQRTFSSWENGVLPGQWESLVALAMEFGYSVDWLLGLTDDPTPLAEVRAMRDERVTYEIDPQIEELVRLFAALEESDRGFLLSLMRFVLETRPPRIIGGE